MTEQTEFKVGDIVRLTRGEPDRPGYRVEVRSITEGISESPEVNSRLLRTFENAGWTVELIERPAVSERDTGAISDGYHTFDELYEYRMLYHAHAARGWLDSGIPVVKSWRHSDGELCFGLKGWFIVTADLPTGQVSNHYPQEAWKLFEVPEMERAPEWDGHTPREAAQRLRDALGDDHGRQ